NSNKSNSNKSNSNKSNSNKSNSNKSNSNKSNSNKSNSNKSNSNKSNSNKSNSNKSNSNKSNSNKSNSNKSNSNKSNSNKSNSNKSNSNKSNNRNISGIDNILDSNSSFKKLKKRVLDNLNLDNIYFDLNKIENKKSLLDTSYDLKKKKKKWYLNFQPLHNVSIEQYWKYDKVNLKDILSSNINITYDKNNENEFKKDKKYLKHISKYILKGNPHESLIKNTFKYSSNNLSNIDKHSRVSFSTNNDHNKKNICSSLLSLNSKAIKNSQSLLNWKLKYSSDLAKIQESNQQKSKHESTYNSNNIRNKNRNITKTHHFQNQNQMNIKHHIKKERQKRGKSVK
ncbi:conserved protein, unknown function, partial [Hepatocystis sp. ex Piliocolobus tephrosceles]